MPHLRTKEFKKIAAQTIRSQQLQGSLHRAIHHFRDGRAKAVEEMTPKVWNELRDKARAIKKSTIENLDFYLDLLSQRVESHGGKVHFAKDAEQARSIVLEIAQAHNVKLITKTKSMVTEEIELNDCLAEHGIESVETDLGEYIIQLAGEQPYHIIAPAMHKTRQQIAHLFGHDGAELPAIEELAGMARQALRQKFLKADMGISGANFVVAETGSVVLVTNEGNARYCTSLPRVHVAVTGMEKLVPTMEGLAVMLRLLPRSATGQRISSYVTIANGARSTKREDGPNEFHLVIVDNGRTRILKDSQYSEILFCMRCGACLNHCPIFNKVGGHAYGATYPGPVGSVVTTMMEGGAEAKDMAFACTLCGICKEVCPYGVDIPAMQLEMRSRINTSSDPRDRKSSTVERVFVRAWYQLMIHPSLLSFARKTGRVLELPFSRNGRIGKLPVPILSQWTRKRDLPVFPARTFRDIWESKLSKEDGREKRR
jgi:L-lactate dehydrogenase complex protein LldF